MTTYLLDTNVLLRFADAAHPQNALTRGVVQKLRRQKHLLRAATQNYIEFWNVATRPANRNGFGKTPVEADRLLRYVERLFPLFPDSPAVYPLWRQLVVTFGVSGVQVHDARLVATMQAHGISHIVTFNVADFARYTNAGITVVDPATIEGS